jgi:aminoglycoside phosphotransferase (APT) family kinase protein
LVVSSARNSEPVASPPGYNVPAVEAWIKSHVEGLSPPFRWTKLEGGHSNLTYLIEDRDQRRAVIRRPPLGELLPKAHDMAREWALISALGSTPVPVPAALGFCDDVGITGARFYVMGHVNGRPLYSAADTERLVPEALRTKLAYSFIDVLAELHAIDPDAVGLGNLGKRDSYVGRQLSTWYKSWTASAGPAQYDDPRAHSLQRLLLEHLPDQGPARVVHGDYGLHNCLIGPAGSVAAVVDWEISTLGDPLADLAYALNQWPDPADRVVRAPTAATSPAGFPARSALSERYSARTGRDLSHLDYYIAFNRWKSAAIIHGVYARYIEGKKSHQGVNLEELRERIDSSLTAAEAAFLRLGL